MGALARWLVRALRVAANLGRLQVALRHRRRRMAFRQALHAEWQSLGGGHTEDVDEDFHLRREACLSISRWRLRRRIPRPCCRCAMPPASRRLPRSATLLFLGQCACLLSTWATSGMSEFDGTRQRAPAGRMWPEPCRPGPLHRSGAVAEGIYWDSGVGANARTGNGTRPTTSCRLKRPGLVLWRNPIMMLRAGRSSSRPSPPRPGKTR